MLLAEIANQLNKGMNEGITEGLKSIMYEYIQAARVRMKQTRYTKHATP